MSSSHDRESELISAAQSGDRSALGQLLVYHSDALSRRLAVRLPRTLGRVASVDDLLQQTFADAFRDIGHFEMRGPGSFFGWLNTIAQRRLQNMIASANRRKRGGGRGGFDPPSTAETSVRDLLAQVAGSDATASQQAVQRELAAALNVAIGQLSDDYREALRLRYFEGYSLDETAVEMGRSTAAIRSVIDRAKHRLREALSNLSSRA